MVSLSPRYLTRLFMLLRSASMSFIKVKDNMGHAYASHAPLLGQMRGKVALSAALEGAGVAEEEVGWEAPAAAVPAGPVQEEALSVLLQLAPVECYPCLESYKV